MYKQHDQLVISYGAADHISMETTVTISTALLIVRGGSRMSLSLAGNARRLRESSGTQQKRPSSTAEHG